MTESTLLDINDRGLELWRGGELILTSPGYAHLQGRNYEYGEDARSRARLHPREINHRFWLTLNTDPLQPAFGPARHSADLVHKHLLQIHEQGGRPDKLVLAVPGSMRRDQLSLLLGIIQQCPFDAVGLIDRAIASIGETPITKGSCYLELHLHQALLTRFTVTADHVQRESATPIPGCGWLAMQDSMAQAIADASIRQSRFDPRRKAATEQQLFDRLPGVMEQLANQRELNLELDGQHLRLDRATLAEACARHYQRISQTLGDDAPQLLLDPSAGALPGIAAHFTNTVAVPAGNLSRSVDRCHDLICADDGDVHFITSLPASTQATPAAVPQAAADPAPAVQTTDEPGPYRIEYADGRFTLYPGPGRAPRVNGSEVTAALQLRTGDTVDAGEGNVLQLLAREVSDGETT